MKTLRGWFAQDMAIDLGTANTLIYVCGQGVVLNEPSVVAIRYLDGDNRYEIAAVGDQAKKMLGRTPDNMETIRPLKDGVIVDYEMTAKMLQHFMRKIYQSSWVKPKPRIVICVPCGATAEDRAMIKKAAQSMQPKSVYLIEEPVAAAIGAGLPIHEPRGTMVIDIGGGTTEVAVLSLGGVVASASLKVGGDQCDLAIVDYIERQFGCLIGEATAEQIKMAIGAASPLEERLEFPVRGRDLRNGGPVSFSINSNEISEALQPVLDWMVEGIYAVIQELPPELAADIAEHGVVLTGGGALLRNIDVYLQESLNFPVMVATDPLYCVAKGGGMVLANAEKRAAKTVSRDALVEA